MTHADIAARVQRLDQLFRGLAKEIQFILKADHPLLWHEWRAYLDAMLDARSGIEAARVALAKAPIYLTHLEGMG